jgi:hypothetical protein
MKTKTLSAKPVSAGTRPAAKKSLPTKAKRPVAKKAARTRANLPVLHAVSATTIGGFQVFGTLVSPKHVTPQQIAEAVASID